MRRITAAAILSASAITTAAWLHAQGREWTTAAFDAQRTGWVRTDARLTRDAVQKGQFQFLWKATFDNDARQLNSLTPPILLDRLIGYRGFKALGFVGGSSDRCSHFAWKPRNRPSTRGTRYVQRRPPPLASRWSTS